MRSGRQCRRGRWEQNNHAFRYRPNDSDPAETIHRAVYVAKSSTLPARALDGGEDVHADPAETLRLISAFTQIEDVGVRDMLLQVTEVLADAKPPGFDA